MRVGLVKEIKNSERRVALTPAAIGQLVAAGHAVAVEIGAGRGAGYSDSDYAGEGADIVSTEVAWACDWVVKVKEPQPSEIDRLSAHQTLFCYLHLAPDPTQTEGLLASGVTAIAFETVADAAGRLPLLVPMSEVAGSLAPQVGAQALHSWRGGRGVLMGGVPGVAPASVLVLGGGVVGTRAARVAAGMGARVTVVDMSVERLTAIDAQSQGLIGTAHVSVLPTLIGGADMIIGAVLLAGAATPRLIGRSDLASLRPGAVLVDVAIDQGGCFESSRPTTHDDPIFCVDGIVHYCVANMPGAVARTSSQALSMAVLPVLTRMLDHPRGWRGAMDEDANLARGLNIHAGNLYQASVGAAQGRPVANRLQLFV